MMLDERDRAGSGDFLAGRLVVHNESGVPLSGAVIDVIWSRPDGSLESQSMVTNSHGVARYQLEVFLTGEFGLAVESASLSGYEFDPENSVLFATITR
jgi:hypothetical protein